MSLSALFAIANTGNNPNIYKTDEWINTVDYTWKKKLLRNKNEIFIHAPLMNLSNYAVSMKPERINFVISHKFLENAINCKGT